MLSTRFRELVEGVRAGVEFLDEVRRAAIPKGAPGPVRALLAGPLAPSRGPLNHPLPAFSRLPIPDLEGRRLALMATGGSGAMASVIGAARALEEVGVRPAVISLCSGAALFGFPIAAGLPADEAAAFVLGLDPSDYFDLDWRMLALLVPRAGQGFGGVMRGEQVEASVGRLLGGMTLGDLPIPAYAPIWNVETNRLEYLGPRTHPELTVARAVRMAMAWPLLFQPVELGGGYWCGGGSVDVFPVKPVLDIEPGCDVALALNGFSPPRFAGEDADGWEERRGSILSVASHLSRSRQLELARLNLERLEREVEVMMIEPVPYEKVKGIGFYHQWLSSAEWPAFMRAGRREARRVLAAWGNHGEVERLPA